MATILTVQNPTYVVRETLDTILRAYSQLSDTHKQLAFKEMQKAAQLSSTVQIACASQAEAQVLVNLFDAYAETEMVTVPSFTNWLDSYEVEFRAGRAVSCTCPDYKNRSNSNPSHVCKHMQDVNLYPQKYGL